MNLIIKYLLSLKTAFVLFLLFLLLLGMGSMSLVNNLAFFSGIDDTPLFRWLAASGSDTATWWIYGMIVLLGVLALSTIACTVDALVVRQPRRQLIAKLSPQIMHIGVLFIMLGHLLTASIGFKMDIVIKKGETKPIADIAELSLVDVAVWKDQNDYDADWEARLLWKERGNTRETSVRPVHPQYFGSMGIYIKSVTTGRDASALLRVCRDPGSYWALGGGLLLSLGGLGFVYGRLRRDLQPAT